MAARDDAIAALASWRHPEQAARRLGMMRTLHIPWDVWQAIHRHLAEALPREAVGLLSVHGAGSNVVGERFYPGENADHSRTRYTMNPVDVRLAFSDMAERGAMLGAIVHSHPRTPAVPSAGDLAEATLPGVLSVIVGFETGIDVRAWRLTFDNCGRARAADEVPVLIWTDLARADDLPRIAHMGLHEGQKS